MCYNYTNIFYNALILCILCRDTKRFSAFLVFWLCGAQTSMKLRWIILAITDKLKKYFNMLPAHLVIVNKTAASIAAMIYNAAIENNSFANNEAFNDGYAHRLEKYIVYYDIGKSELPVKDIKIDRAVTETEMVASRKTIAILEDVFNVSKLTGEEKICKEILYYAIERNEQFDGLGFPKCIKGKAISPIGRILSVAEYVARKFIDGNRKDELIKKLKLKAGKKFDPEVVSLTIGVIEELYAQAKVNYEGTTDELRSIQMLYQPICDAAGNVTKTNAGYICLNDPKRGVLMPSFYLSVAERNGRIMDVTKYGIEILFRDMFNSKLGGVGVSRNFSVGVSKECISKPSFLIFIKKMIRDYAVNPQRLTLEINASDIDLNDVKLIEALDGYRELGIKLAIDNYGIDDASLTKLQEIEFDVIKIDRSFIEKICDNRKTYEIVKNIVKMSEDLKVDVVAKGVDTEQQKQFLLDMNCLYMQGRLFGEPEYFAI